MSRTAKWLFFGVTLVTGVAATAAAYAADTQVTSTAKPAASAGKAGSSSDVRAGRSVTSDVSELEGLGIDINADVLIDVADDGLDRYMAVGRNGVVDFTGTGRTDNTMMTLKPAQVSKRNDATKNRVVIAPSFYNEDLGPGYCVADTAPGVLKLATCAPGSAAQTWQVVPGGDSGQFELHGAKTVIRVDNGRITTNGKGYLGLQTIKFADK